MYTRPAVKPRRIGAGIALAAAVLLASPSRTDRVWLPWLAPDAPRVETELRYGRPEGDFPAISEPRFVPAARARIAPNAFVFGCAAGSEAHAYALRLLDGHEIVNDVVGREPIVATY